MLSKLGKFFTIGGREEDTEEYQAIHSADGTSNYGTQPFLSDAVMESHNLEATKDVGGDSEYDHIQEKYQPIGDRYQKHKHHTAASRKTHASMIVHTGRSHFHIKSDSRHSHGDISADGASSRTHGRIDTSIISTTDSDSLASTGTDISNIDSKSPPLLGMILVTISAVCYAALNLSVKALMDETPWQELMIIRMGITWMATMVWILWQYKGTMSLWGPADKRLLLLWRAVFLWGAMFCCWWSFEFLPVGDGTTLAMSFPVWVTVIAHFVFRNENNGISSNINQRLDKWGWICVFSGLIGVIFVAQPSFIFGDLAETESDDSDDKSGPSRDIGVILGLSSAVCAGAQYVIVNYTKEDCHWLQVEQITAFLSTFVLMPAGFVIFATVKYYNTGHFDIGWENLNALRWFEEVALGLLGFCALALLTRGSQLDAPARTAICLYLQIPVTYAGQCLMTQSIPDVWVWIGIVLVLASVIVPAVRKLRAAKEQQVALEKARMEERRQRRLALQRLDASETDDSDLSSNDNSDNNNDVDDNDNNSHHSKDSEDRPLLDPNQRGHSHDSYHSYRSNSHNSRNSHSHHSNSKSRSQMGIGFDEIPKYTINVSGGRSGRSGRKKRTKK